MSTLYYHPRRGGKATKVAANRLAVLDTIRERADAATPGPWKVTWDGENDPDGAWSAEWPWLIRQDIYPGKSVANLAEVEASTEDAEFIAHARTDIPVLLAHIDALLAEIDALKSEIELLRVELGNRPTEGAKPVDVWPDRW